MHNRLDADCEPGVVDGGDGNRPAPSGRGEPKVQELLRIAGPYQYRHRVSVPKLILNATGDEFLLPDSSQFYWDELRGENYLRVVPNAATACMARMSSTRLPLSIG